MHEIDTTENTAKYLEVSQSYLRQARVKGTGPAFTKLGRSVRYRRQDVDQWVLSNKRFNTLNRNKA